MRDAALGAFSEATIVIKAAAVADYRPEKRAGAKMKKTDPSLNVKLVKNPDILAELGRNKCGRFIVGFAAETSELVENAVKKLGEKNLDMVIANDVTREGAGFTVDTNIVKILYCDGAIEDMPLMGKEKLADLILDRVVERLGARP
jgi:phosphopantothenoylcysteine decarboxylase/phosphopantothenate--cysteine ligase